MAIRRGPVVRSGGEATDREIVWGRVVRKTDSAAVLEVGGDYEGVVGLDEFEHPAALQPGDEVEVFVESLDADGHEAVVSKRKADFLRAWDKLEAAYKAHSPVPGRVVDRTRGGATVHLRGIEAFLPASQAGLRGAEDLGALVGGEHEFRILTLSRRRRSIVVSRRILLSGGKGR